MRINVQLKEEKQKAQSPCTADCSAKPGAEKDADGTARTAHSESAGGGEGHVDVLHGRHEDVLSAGDRKTKRPAQIMVTTAADDDCSSQQRRQQRVQPSQQERSSAKAIAAMEGPATSSKNEELRPVREKARGHSGVYRDFGLLRWIKSMAKKRRVLRPRSMRYKF